MDFNQLHHEYNDCHIKAISSPIIDPNGDASIVIL
jgi:hypothetical protein